MKHFNSSVSLPNGNTIQHAYFKVPRVAPLKNNQLFFRIVFLVSALSIFFLALNLLFFSKAFFEGKLGYSGTVLQINGGSIALPEIIAGSAISQSFYSDQEGISSIGFQVGTFMRQNSVQLKAELTNSKGQVLRSKTFDVSNHPDNTYLIFDFIPLKNSYNQNFLINISSPDGKPGNAVTLWATSEDSYVNGTLTIGAEKTQMDLIMFVKYFSERP
jgi:hypothetical protein